MNEFLDLHRENSVTGWYKGFVAYTAVHMAEKSSYKYANKIIEKVVSCSN